MPDRFPSLLPKAEPTLAPKQASDSMWMLSPRVAWGIALVLLVGAAIISSGAPMGAIALALGAVGVLFAWQFPYLSFYIVLATAPLLSWIVSFSTGQLQIGDRAFGGSIDVSVGEVLAACVLVAWAARLLFLWQGRRDRHWKPWLPLFFSYLLLIGAHVASIFSPADPDKLLALKYTLRPVMVAYVLYVALPANFIRSKRRLMGAMFTLVLVGSFFALDGLRSLFTFTGGAFQLYRARPLPILGVSPIGENHNVLAELMLFTAPLAFALAGFIADKIQRRWLYASGVLMAGIALLTFARSAWIAFLIQIIILSVTVWRRWLLDNRALARYAVLAFLPLFAYFIIFSSSAPVQSSTDARAMLSGIALQLFESNPILGAGAGTFMDHVSKTWVFTFEFGGALDSHGVIQKILAETGLVGFAAFSSLCLVLVIYMWQTAQALKSRPVEYRIFAFLAVAVIGAFIYQVFNTTYWTAKLWLPVGMMFAASRVLLERAKTHEPDFLKSAYE